MQILICVVILTIASKMAKCKRIVLSIEDKLSICTCASKGKKPASLAREFELSKSTVTDTIPKTSLM